MQELFKSYELNNKFKSLMNKKIRFCVTGGEKMVVTFILSS